MDREIVIRERKIALALFSGVASLMASGSTREKGGGKGPRGEPYLFQVGFCQLCQPSAGRWPWRWERREGTRHEFSGCRPSAWRTRGQSHTQYRQW